MSGDRWGTDDGMERYCVSIFDEIEDRLRAMEQRQMARSLGPTVFVRTCQSCNWHDPVVGSDAFICTRPVWLGGLADCWCPMGCLVVREEVGA